MARKKTFHVFREANKTGPYDERPMLPDAIDIQLFMSRNDHAQPFHLICEKDTLLCQILGKGRVEFKGTAINYYSLTPGDYIYVPAGTPHRLIPEEENTTVRYKAQDAGLEGVAWYCEKCSHELFREVWDTKETISHEAYLRLTTKFSDNLEIRTCEECGDVHEPIDVSPYRWESVAEEIREVQAKST